MTDPAQPNEQVPATRSEWLALMREAVRLEMAADHKDTTIVRLRRERDDAIASLSRMCGDA